MKSEIGVFVLISNIVHISYGLLSGCRYAHCSLKPNKNLLPYLPNEVCGDIDFKQTDPNALLQIRVNISGLNPYDGYRLHGMHVHCYGDLSDCCESTGGHYNPYKVIHGGPFDYVRHVGDFGNLREGRGGTIRTKFTDSVSSLFDGSQNIIGRGVVIHAMRDDLGRGGSPRSLLSGNAGPRLACCVVGHACGDRW